MTNGEKYKTAQERAVAFRKWCDGGNDDCTNTMCVECQMKWLDLEYEEEKPLPCPFCGNDKFTIVKDDVGSQVECRYCGYRSLKCGVYVNPILVHNRVAKAVKESEANHEG